MMTDPDPVFAAIEWHLATDIAWGEAVAAGDAADALHAAEFDAMTRLLETTPTTIAGVAALLKYIGSWGRQPRGSALFDDWAEPRRSAGAAFLPRLGDALERIADRMATALAAHVRSTAAT